MARIDLHKRFLSLDERLRFLLVGGYNTGVAYVLFALLYLVLPSMHYLVILGITYVLAMLNSVMALRVFVFARQRSWWREVMRCAVIYAGVLVLNAGLLALLIDVVSIHTLIAQAISMVFITISSYCGHKFFSFRPV